LAEVGTNIIGFSATMELEGSAFEKSRKQWGNISEPTNVIFQTENLYINLSNP
tara:strand:- start:16894 stop:17052 length:159 start_codon:yes stop_codon:yes gene_type:complete